MSAKLHRDLGLLEVSCISAGVMISSGLFILPALAYAKAGPGMVISYLISSLIIIPSLLSISELVTAMPRTGGIYYFTGRSMGAVPLLLAGAFVLCSLSWYFGFTRRQIKREYALIYILEQITGVQSTDQMLEEELREVVLEGMAEDSVGRISVRQ